MQKQWQFLQAQIEENDCGIQTAARAVTAIIEPEIVASASSEEQSGAKKGTRKKSSKNSIGPVMRELGKSYYGVDLCEIPGVGDSVIATLMSELGLRKEVLRNFRSSGAFCSWLALCPDNRISGGRVLKAKTRRVNNRVAGALRLGVWTLERSDHAMGHYTRRMKARLGKAEGITASAHKLGRIIYGVLESQAPYDEKTAFQTTAGSACPANQVLTETSQISRFPTHRCSVIYNVLLRSGFSRCDVISSGRAGTYSRSFSAKCARSESTAELRLKLLTTFASSGRSLQRFSRVIPL